MKHSFRILTAGLAALLVLSLTACGGGSAASDAAPSGPDSTAMEPDAAPSLTRYTAQSGTFALSVPEIDGGWTQTDGGNEYHLVLDNSDRSFSVLLQALPLEQAQSTFDSLDELVDYYRSSTLSAYGEPTSASVTVGDPALAGVVADEYTAESNGVTAKALVSYFATDNAYYICTLTGLAEAYDANIDAVRGALTSFTEL